MTLHKRLMTAFALALAAAPALADSKLAVKDAYARVSSPAARSGAIFMVIENHGSADDRLVAAASDAAARTELHTHIETDGIMRMVEVTEGFPVPAHGSHALARGADHVMLLGLTGALADGDSVALTLTFESGTTLDLKVPVDSARTDMAPTGDRPMENKAPADAMSPMGDRPMTGAGHSH